MNALYNYQNSNSIHPEDIAKEYRRLSLLLLIICAVTLLPFLGVPDFNTKGEPREAVVSLSMIEQSNWILPVNNGGEIPYKPPFFHWLIAFFSLFNGGHVNEYTSRLPSAIALMAMTFATLSFFRRQYGNKTAFAIALVAFTTFELHRAAMNCRVDMVLTALTVGAIMLLFRWGCNNLRGIPWWAILLMSCGTMTKGPVGILVPCLVVGIYLLLRGVKFFKAFFPILFAGIASLILPSLWYIAAYSYGGQEFLDLVIEENFGRMTNTMGYDSCVNPWYYNVFTLLGGFIPWTLAAFMGLFILPWKNLKDIRLTGLYTRLKSEIRNMNTVALLSLTATIVIFLFYCFPQSKRSVYLMPLYPFLSLFVTEMMLRIYSRRGSLARAFGDIVAAIAIALPVLEIIIIFGLIPESIFGTGRHAEQNIAMLHALRHLNGVMAWISLCVSPVLAIAWWSGLRRANATGLTINISFVTLGIYISLAGAYQPAILDTRSARPVAQQIEKIAPVDEGNLYEFISEGEFAAGDPLHFFELNFYLNDRIHNFLKDLPDNGFLIITDKDADDYFPQFEQNGYVFSKPVATKVPLMKKKASVYRFVRTCGNYQMELYKVD